MRTQEGGGLAASQGASPPRKPTLPDLDLGRLASTVVRK